MKTPTLVGRSSSNFTRITRIFAHELGIPLKFVPLYDITSMRVEEYGGNPALKVPVLVDAAGPVFGSENVCRELVRRAGAESRVVMRGASPDRVVTNMEELTLCTLSAEVPIVMAKLAGNTDAVSPKIVRSMANSLAYLDENVSALAEKLPDGRQFSFIEVALYCLMTHLVFREVADVTPYPKLRAFADAFGKRESAKATTYSVDTKP